MPSAAAEKAKAKYDAVINHPNRNDASNYNRRVLTTRDPIGGGMCNTVTRRPSTASQGSSGTSPGRIRTMWNGLMNRPAF
ncbi:hypothetical protein B0T10DRAFT_487489 [Thelonectria olida]|uniref:Uncharacterized protein n=1 Tax=Thelonectria olida TaxID=1576542 RepID=A0A9P8W6Z3_9HYPO|nr:hypothetical protein B0T10DRAFT_487489 [Thelonectria olida]